MTEWWMAVGGHQVGPVAESEIVANIKNGSVDGSTLVFTTGMGEWTPLKDVDKFKQHLGARRPLRPCPRCPGGGPTRSTSRSKARTCSSWRSSSIPARPWSRKRAS